MSDGDIAVVATVACAMLIVAMVLGVWYREGRLTRTNVVPFVGGMFLVTPLVLLIAGSTGIGHLIFAPAYLIGSGMFLLHYAGENQRRFVTLNLRQFGWIMIAIGIGTAVVTLVALRAQ